MPIYYQQGELEGILSLEDGQKKVFVPNEIFEDLINAINSDDKGKSSKHVAFAFAYHYLAMYLWRFAKYGGDFDFTEDELKKICTVSPHSKGEGSITYITKRDGLLAKLGYIEKVSDYPIWQVYIPEEDELRFGMLSDYKDNIPYWKNVRNRKVNEPLKLTQTRICKIGGEVNELNGILYDVDNTTLIPVDVYIYCMARKDLGCEGFYLYCYLKFMNDRFGRGWNCPLDKIPTKVGMKRDIVKDRLKALEEYNMIDNNHVPFVPGLRDYTSKQIPANTYKTKEYSEFIKISQPKRQIKKRPVMSPETYEKEIGFDSISLEVEMDFLPEKEPTV
jgi:hypothetical protein